MNKLLIANRGEITIRIINAACDLDMTTVTIYSEDDKLALHTKKSDESYPLKGIGTTAYLDIPQIIDIAQKPKILRTQPLALETCSSKCVLKPLVHRVKSGAITTCQHLQCCCCCYLFRTFGPPLVHPRSS